MTPPARLAAAIEVLDRILAGAPAEAALLGWARGNRYAGAGDREAVRDAVFRALRCRRSHAALGGAETGRGLVLGALREDRIDPDALFTGARHAPAPLTAAERAHLAAVPDLPGPVALDVPDWLAAPLAAALGADFAPVLTLFRRRAPVFLRANLLRASPDAAAAALAAEGVITHLHPLAATALEVTAGARRVRRTRAYAEGLVEVQDAGSQAVVEALPQAARILDLCAGGGGKTLALAARFPAAALFAHDAAPARMADLPRRAARAGVRVALLDADGPEREGPFDLVLADVPCSGSGAWRRQPEAKWTLTPDRLAALHATQDAILDRASALVAPRGWLAYVTCSLLPSENADRVRDFLRRRPGWHCAGERRISPLEGGDGFYLALLTRERLRS